MGKIILTPEQKIILERFKKEPFLVDKFYFTGGTALSIFYLHHRLSDDLDFFTEEKFETGRIIELVRRWGKELDFEIVIKEVESVLIFQIEFKNRAKTKVDFNYYPYKRLKKSKLVEGLFVDSLLDIAVNKLLSINQRIDVKDLVDLYFFRKRFTVWDLMEGVRVKFGFKLDPVLVAADFMKVEEFDFLPRMLVPLKISDLRNYFKQKAKKMIGKFTVR